MSQWESGILCVSEPHHKYCSAVQRCQIYTSFVLRYKTIGIHPRSNSLHVLRPLLAAPATSLGAKQPFFIIIVNISSVELVGLRFIITTEKVRFIVGVLMRRVPAERWLQSLSDTDQVRHMWRILVVGLWWADRRRHVSNPNKNFNGLQPFSSSAVSYKQPSFLSDKMWFELRRYSITHDYLNIYWSRLVS